VKPAPFAYHRPERREEVDSLLAELGDEAKVLAGGQSLIPLLNMRLCAAGHLVDLNGLCDEPSKPEEDGGWLCFGPLVRQAAAERSPLVARRAPLVREALGHVAHPAIRTRGTVAGSVAHADPAGELPAAVVLLGGEVHLRSARGRRAVPAAEFVLGELETAAEADEWVEEVRVPAAAEGAGYAMEELSRRHGDYALCGVAAAAEPADGGPPRLALAYLGMGARPERLELPPGTEDADLPEVVGALVRGRLDPGDDLHASREYRLRLGAGLGARAARRALGAAG
jgi:carbon-monoxide dehydrogenase medium subunit